jgi:EAL domain-containing protein (putative c-di-GMP-specific phosphodiesterase class I)
MTQFVTPSLVTNHEPTPAGATADWTLVGNLPGFPGLTETPLARSPFILGRDPASDLQLRSGNVSKRHAEIIHSPAIVFVRDLGSTNGTFVNGRRITDATPVGENDLIQFADVELKLGRRVIDEAEGTRVSNRPEDSWLISRMHEVLNEGRMTIHFQPIVVGRDHRTMGYEALVRSDVVGLQSPIALFSAAARLGLEERLSEVCRETAVRTIEQARLPGALFLNTHPNEYLGAELVDSMRILRRVCDRRPLVLEVHEAAVPELDAMTEFKAKLGEIGVQLAFDDFGAGQSRLLELSRVQPDYLKFDRSLVKDLGTPNAAHAELVESLHRHATALGIATLAEGVETPESVQACKAIGFTHFQGYAFGRPQPVETYAQAAPAT